MPLTLKNFNQTPAPIWLCFKANTAGSTVQLTTQGTPTAVTLETSTDGETWSSYTIGNTITLSNIGDKVYMRNTSGTDTGFSTSYNNYYYFVMTGSINGSGDVNSLLNKNSTMSLSQYCYLFLFTNCSSLITAPNLPSTVLQENCYGYMFRNCTGLTTIYPLNITSLEFGSCNSMFNGCTSLTTLPKLSTTTIPNTAYQSMFQGCTKIKLSTTQTGEYQTAYRIPTTGTGSTTGTYSLSDMFKNTGGTFTGTPSINTTYYTSNTVV